MDAPCGYSVYTSDTVTPLQAFKHLFIPHVHNEYKPHIFREIAVASIVVSSIFLLGFSAGSSYLIHRTVLGAQVTASVLIDLTNETRLAYNKAPLVRNETLDKAAVLKAEDMAGKGYFAHTSPEGVTPWHWFREVGYDFLYAGENLAINFTDPALVRDAWLASPLHRENLLDTKFKEIGIAAVSGVYQDGPTIYVVQMFGTPSQTKNVQAAPRATSRSSTTSLAMATSASSGNPEIRGERVEEEEWWTKHTFSDAKLVVADDPEKKEKILPNLPQQNVIYSKWYERLLFGGTYYVDSILRLLLIGILVALITMLLVEIRKQHWKHIVYALSVLLIISLCIIINQIFW